MILLDTHIFVWWNQNDPKLSSYHREVIENERPNGLGVCTISLIEIARLEAWRKDNSSGIYSRMV